MMEHGKPASTCPLQVGLIAAPWVTVPPTVYGGTELVIDLLARGLAEAGCDVRLFATGDATCPVPRAWLYPRALGTTAPLRAELPHLDRAYRDLAGVDVIHDHTLSGPLRTGAPPTAAPVITTMHGELLPDLRPRYAGAAKRGVEIIAISHAQRRSAPEVPVAAVIHHGIDVAAIPMGSGDGEYVLFLGRMSPDKGAHRAIAAARAAGRRIVLAAKMWEPEEHRYFIERVEPMLGPDATYVGEVGPAEKLELLCGAAALLNPIRWPEPFGLVMIEALACGTPVLAFAEGSAPEIVEPGRTGFLCRDEGDMARHLAHLDRIDRAACRASAASRFSAQRMVDDHLRLYRAVLERRATLDVEEDRILDLTDHAALVPITAPTLAATAPDLPPARAS
jgi:glycosyltransferase involved in cell wall biosynthesis